METYRDLNAELNLYDKNGRIQFEKDEESARAFFLEHVNQNTVFFHSLEEKKDYLIENGLWDEEVANRYSFSEFKSLFKRAYAHKFRFKTFLGAYKFYSSYALRNFEGNRYLERFEDRVVMTAITHSSNIEHAGRLVDHIIEGRFQPATPTFLNAGRADAGGPTSCFLLRVDDSLESINRAQSDAGQLSKRGGGVALSLTNMREAGAPIKKYENKSSGVVPFMKVLEDTFSYIDQLGQRQGAGAVYLNAHHPDIMAFLDTKRENADEKVRIKTLSIGIVIPDITFELARNNEEMYLFSPYDVEREYGVPMTEISVTEEYYRMLDNPNIRKKSINARKFFQTIAELQFESGYPYLMFEDTVNYYNPAPNVGRISQSNLCSEILQPQTPSKFNVSGEFERMGRDIACNLGSMNVAKMMEADEDVFRQTVKDAQRFLTNVARYADFECSPSVEFGNQSALAIGLGQMNLHGYLISRGVDYDSQEAVGIWRDYIAAVTFEAINASCEMAQEEGFAFSGFEGSDWQNGRTIQVMIDTLIDGDDLDIGPNSLLDSLHTAWEWSELKERVGKYGLMNQHLQAVPPTGSISYINNSTSSIHPIASKIEIRKEGKLGRAYYPAYGLTNENFDNVKTAYEMDQKAIIDMYAASTPFIDQGQSLTLFFRDTATTRDLNRAQIYAHKAGVKTIYYVRIMQNALEGTEVDGCVSCML